MEQRTLSSKKRLLFTAYELRSQQKGKALLLLSEPFSSTKQQESQHHALEEYIKKSIANTRETSVSTQHPGISLLGWKSTQPVLFVVVFKFYGTVLWCSSMVLFYGTVLWYCGPYSAITMMHQIKDNDIECLNRKPDIKSIQHEQRVHFTCKTTSVE